MEMGTLVFNLKKDVLFSVGDAFICIKKTGSKFRVIVRAPKDIKINRELVDVSLDKNLLDVSETD